MKKRIVLSIVISMTLILCMCGCGGRDDATVAGGDENATSEETVGSAPFSITVTDKNEIYVEVEKDFYNPENALNTRMVDFFRGGEKVLFLEFTQGAGDSRCLIGYGEMGDTKTTCTSDFGGYEDKGDSLLYTIYLDRPDVTISGGDNLPVDPSVFEGIETYSCYDSEDNFLEGSAAGVIILDVDENLAASRESGLAKIEERLYKNDEDRQMISPDSDDFRVEIYEVEHVPVATDTDVLRRSDGLLVFGIDSTKTEEKKAYVYRVCSYDEHGNLESYREKTELESESDALHVMGADAHGGNGYVFYDNTGENRIPDDFDETATLAVICDEIMPYYRADEIEVNGATFTQKRVGESYYRICDEFAELNGMDENYLVTKSEDDFLGQFLGMYGVEFSADNADDEGFIEVAKGNASGIVYYSKPEKHAHNLTSGEDEGLEDGSLPEDFVEMDTDAKYFKPKSEDYILYYSMFEDYGDVKFNNTAVLISFDKSGNITDAKLRMYRSSNTVNPMSELIEGHTNNGMTLLWNDDNVAYFDIIDSPVLTNTGYTEEGQLPTKNQLIENCIEEEFIFIPGYGASKSNGMYISKKQK